MNEHSFDDSSQSIPKRIKIETPIGSVESDSGSHLLDLFTVVIIIAVFFVFKNLYK